MSSKQNNQDFSYEQRFKKVANLIHSASNINEILIELKDEILKLFDAERVTIYLVDRKNREIFSRVKTGVYPQEIRIPIDFRSIAGYVAAKGRKVNISNVYNKEELAAIDPQLSFDYSWDEKSGFRTKQVLTVPILFQKFLMGVVQIMNRVGEEVFTRDDEKNLADIAETLGIAFHNQYLITRRVDPRYWDLLRKGLIDEKKLCQAREDARQEGVDLEYLLVSEYNISRQDLGVSQARYLGIQYEDLSKTRYNPRKLLKGKNLEYFIRSLWMPLEIVDGLVVLVINNPNDVNLLHEIRRIFRTNDIELRFALKQEIIEYIESFRKKPRIAQKKMRVEEEKSLDDLLEEIKEMDSTSSGAMTDDEDDEAAVNDSAIVLLARKIINDGFHQGASDIHIEPYGLKTDAMVRYRIDGRCVKVLDVPRRHIRALVSRFKILSKLDISERRKPQDGKIRFRTSKGREIELRVATVPTSGGNEDVVIRILSASEPLPLEQIMPRESYEPFIDIIGKPYGIVLVVGPTGSGKTTTLHAALAHINTLERKIWTAEDPVEITQFGLRQVQVMPKIGFTFASAMRAFLRADPDVIMVGEMRDQETVSMGIEASLTGHLVLSTLHTNSAPETITRLIDMGMDPFNFADALLGILAQRLVRTFCPTCREAYVPDRNEYDHIRALYGDLFDERVKIGYSEKLKFYHAFKCDECRGNGYKGRMGLYELLLGSDNIKKMIVQRASVEDLRAAAIHGGMETLLQDGIRRVFDGNTDLGQVMAVCNQ